MLDGWTSHHLGSFSAHFSSPSGTICLRSAKGVPQTLHSGRQVSHVLRASFLFVAFEPPVPSLPVSSSSNKLLGLFGQELATPCPGFPYSEATLDLSDPIVIVVSHSGGTFGPLACSNLLQSFSSSIFAVTSEWDTQVGKQLRSMYNDDLLSSRIFSTEVGVRSAEPCSVSVAATHQLLTLLFEHICVTIISDTHFSKAAGAVVKERDLQCLERCNQECISALEEIVGVDSKGHEIHERRGTTEQELRGAGNLWADHVLENAKVITSLFATLDSTCCKMMCAANVN